MANIAQSPKVISKQAPKHKLHAIKRKIDLSQHPILKHQHQTLIHTTRVRKLIHFHQSLNDEEHTTWSCCHFHQCQNPTTQKIIKVLNHTNETDQIKHVAEQISMEINENNDDIITKQRIFKLCNIRPSKRSKQSKYTHKKSKESMRLLQEQGHEKVKITTTWPTKTEFETDLVTAYWFVYKIHSDSLIHLISSAFKTFLNETISVTLTKNSKNVTEYLYWAIWANCEVCRKHRKVAGYQNHDRYGNILKRHMGKRVLFADILFLPPCKNSIKNLHGNYMVLVMASIKTSHLTGKIIHGKIHAKVIDDKCKNTVLQHIANFNDLPNVGLPDVIWTDRGSEFINDAFRSYAIDRNISNIFTPPRSSPSNGAIERIVGLTRQALRSIAGERNITMHEVHDFVDLAIERVNANYFISRLGRRWRNEFWDYCPRLTTLNDMIQLAKDNYNNNLVSEGDLSINEIAYWKPNSLNKDDQAIKVKVLGKATSDGSHAYLVEQIDKTQQKGISSISTIHLALRRDLAIVEDNIKQRILDTFQQMHHKHKESQTDTNINHKLTQCNIIPDNDGAHFLNTNLNKAWQDNDTQTTPNEVISECIIHDKNQTIEIHNTSLHPDIHVVTKEEQQEIETIPRSTSIITMEEYRQKLAELTQNINTFIQTKYEDKKQQQLILIQLEKERLNLEQIWQTLKPTNNANIMTPEQITQVVNQYKLNIIKHPTHKRKRQKRRKIHNKTLPTIWETAHEDTTESHTSTQHTTLTTIPEKEQLKLNICRFRQDPHKIPKRHMTILKQEIIHIHRTRRTTKRKELHRGGLKIQYDIITSLQKQSHQQRSKFKLNQNHDINNQSINTNDIVMYADKDQYGNTSYKLGKVVKIITKINKVVYNNDSIHDQKSSQILNQHTLEIPIIIMQQLYNIKYKTNIQEEIQLRNKNVYRPVWVSKGQHMGWAPTVSKDLPTIHSKPLCDMRAITHVLKINRIPQDNIIFDKFYIKTQEALIHNNMQRLVSKHPTLLKQHYSINQYGRIHWLTRSNKGTLRRMTSHEINFLGLTSNIEIMHNTHININDDISKDTQHSQDTQPYVDSLWAEMQQKSVYYIQKEHHYQYVRPNKNIQGKIKTCKHITQEIKQNHEQEQIHPFKVYREPDYIDDNIFVNPKHKWITNITNNQQDLLEKSQLFENWETRFPSMYEFEISPEAREQLFREEEDNEDDDLNDPLFTHPTIHDPKHIIKLNNVTSHTNNEEKRGVVGLDKNIVLTGLHPDDPIHKLVKQAKMKEWLSFKKQKVLTPVTREGFDKARAKDPSAACLPMRWVLEWKIIDGQKSIKARLVAQGTIRKDRREGVLTEVALPNHRALYTMFQWQVQQKHWNPKTSILQGDLKTAFLQAENRSDVVFVTKPKDDGAMTSEDRDLIDSMFSKDRIPIARAVMTLYGTRDAPANLDMAVRKSLFDKGFKETLTCPNLYRRFTAKGIKYQDFIKLTISQQQQALKKGQVLDAWVFAYVDDLLMGTGETPASEIALDLQQRWIFKETPTPPDRFLGIFIKPTEKGIFIDQELLASSLKRIISSYIWEHHESLQLPLLREIEHIEKEHVECLLIKGGKGILSEKKITKYKSLLGMLSYLSHTRPDLLFTISFFGQFAAQPSGIALKYLQIACSYAAKTATYGLQFLTPEAQKEMGGDFSRIQQSNELKMQKSKSHSKSANKPQPLPKIRDIKHPERGYNIEVFTDASFKLGAGKAHAGHLILLNKSLVSAKSTLQKRKAGSSTRAELLALAESLDNALAIKFLLLEMGVEGNDITMTVWCDNDNTVTNINSINPKTSEFQSTFLLRQLYRIIKQGSQADSIRIIFPRLMDTLEGQLQNDEFGIINYADGPMERYRSPTEMKQSLHAFKDKFGKFDSILDKELAIYEIIIDKLNDSQIQVLHLEGKNQLADGLTKMATSIDYVGRILFDHKQFLLGKATPIRDQDGPITYRIKGHRERYNIQNEPNDDPNLPPENMNIHDWITHMENNDSNYQKIQKR